MLTREEILALPASELAEVSARMMGGKDLMYWFPHTVHDHAKMVADWVVNTIKAQRPSEPESARLDVANALEDVGASILGWDWTPEQLTRAALLARVDAGGEI